MKEKAKLSLPTVGLSSLLVIFGVLCLTVFALLTLSAAQAETGLAEKSRASQQAYFEAQAQAHEILAQLRAGELPQGVAQHQGIYEYSCPMGQTQCLWVQVRLQGSQYRILRWQVCSTIQWEADDHLPVWGGNAERRP